jgi:hypothetical protein
MQGCWVPHLFWRIEMVLSGCVLRKACEVQVGDKVCFEMPSVNYTVAGVDQTAIGMVRHQHATGSSAYWPDELVYVEVPDVAK